jgi:hypothetical protein
MIETWCLYGPNNVAVWDTGTATPTDTGAPDLTYYVKAVDNGYPFVRVQGVTLELASKVTIADRIALTVRLHGKGGVFAEEYGECRGCTELTVTHRYYGFHTKYLGVPEKLYQNAGCSGVIEAGSGVYRMDVHGGVDYNP